MVFGQQEVRVNSSVNCFILDMPFVLCLISLSHSLFHLLIPDLWGITDGIRLVCIGLG